MEPLALGVFVAGTLALARTRRTSKPRTTRNVTLEDLEAISYEDLLKIEESLGDFRPKISIYAAKKEALTRRVADMLKETYFVGTFNTFMMSNREVKEFRKELPAGVIARVVPLKVFKAAAADTEWAGLENVHGGQEIVFVRDEKDLKPTIKAVYKAMEDAKVVEKLQGAREAGFPVINTLSGGGMIRDEWEFIPGEDIKKLENFQTKSDLLASIAGGVKQVTTKVAKGIKEVPRKIATGTKKITEKMEEEGKDSVGDVTA
jgi:large subunit ribosomal protein L10